VIESEGESVARCWVMTTVLEASSRDGELVSSTSEGVLSVWITSDTSGTTTAFCARLSSASFEGMINGHSWGPLPASLVAVNQREREREETVDDCRWSAWKLKYKT